MPPSPFYRILMAILCLCAFSIPGCQCTSCSSCNSCAPDGHQQPLDIKANNLYRVSQVNQDKPHDTKRDPGTIDQGGKLYITRTDVFYIREGKVLWQSSPAQRYQKQDNRYFVATGDYVFCVKEEGTVIWKRTLPNKGSCDIKEGKLYVATDRGVSALNLGSGLNEP